MQVIIIFFSNLSWILRAAISFHLYTAKLLFHVARTRHSDYTGDSGGVATVNNWWQHFEQLINFVVTMLVAVNNSDCLVTVQ